MRPLVRSVGIVLAGIIIGVALIAGLEALGSMFYPLPEGLDTSDPAAMRAYTASLPIGALVLVLAGWGIAAMTGALVASRLAARMHVIHGLIVGAVLLSAGIANMLMLPHPTWFWAAALVVFPVFTWLGATLGAASSKRQPRD